MEFFFLKCFCQTPTPPLKSVRPLWMTPKKNLVENHSSLWKLQSIVRAHENLQSGRIYIGDTEVKGASRNRSPTSYLLNPEEERALLVYCQYYLNFPNNNSLFRYNLYKV